jgi:hypothetical protein
MDSRLRGNDGKPQPSRRCEELATKQSRIIFSRLLRHFVPRNDGEITSFLAMTEK